MSEKTLIEQLAEDMKDPLFMLKYPTPDKWYKEQDKKQKKDKADNHKDDGK